MDPCATTRGLYAGHGQVMGKSRARNPPLREKQQVACPFLERTTGFEPATPTLAMLWEMSIASPPVSAVPLSCTFLALLSHQSHQIAGVDSISLVTSLVETGRHVSPRRWPAATTLAPDPRR